MPKKTTSSRNGVVAPDLKSLFAPKNDEQGEFLHTIDHNLITFVRGPAGTGKSYIAIAYALSKLLQHRYSHLILTRPIVQAGSENIGYLPGILEEKTRDYFSPMFSIMLQMIDAELLKILTKNNGAEPSIKILPLAFMRGCTFSKTVVVMDEAQNCTIEQMRLFLTRFGEGSKMIVCGDVKQSDIHKLNGLSDAFELFKGINGIGFVTLSKDAIVRHPIIKDIEDRYDNRPERSI